MWQLGPKWTQDIIYANIFLNSLEKWLKESEIQKKKFQNFQACG